VSEVLLSVSNRPTELRSILARHDLRKGSTDIRFIEGGPLVLTDAFSHFNGATDVRDDVATRVVELEWSAPWGRPST
jgi:hypothetical protein